MNSAFFEELKARGLVYQVTDEEALQKQLNYISALIQRQTVYTSGIYCQFLCYVVSNKMVMCPLL